MHTIQPQLLAVLATALSVFNASALRFTDASYFVPKGVVGKPYHHVFELAAGGGSPPYHYVIPRNGKLPPGLTLGHEDGKVTGTPLAAGKWSLWLHGVDSGLQHGFWDMQTEREFTFEVLPALVIQQQSIEPTVRNRPYRTRLTAEGGGTQVWSLDSGTLPRGIILEPNGTLSGTASNAGHFTFVVKVSDAEWDAYAVGKRKHMAGFRSDTRTLMLWVAKVGIELPTNGFAPLPKDKSIEPIHLSATGGIAPYAWALAGTGKLPAGLTLDPAQGIIQGKPEKQGSFPLVLYVKDAKGAVGIGRTTLEVR